MEVGKDRGRQDAERVKQEGTRRMSRTDGDAQRATGSGSTSARGEGI
jgi:hypothetical protein